jgi:hypothetical protein
MARIVSISTHDADASYVLTAEATGPQTATIAERKTDKATGAVTNASYDISDATVVNGVLNGALHLPGFQHETIELDLGDGMDATIRTGGLWFGVGAQTLGPWPLSSADASAIIGWLNNFPHS